jgi:hypothetical protein
VDDDGTLVCLALGNAIRALKKKWSRTLQAGDPKATGGVMPVAGMFTKNLSHFICRISHPQIQHLHPLFG